MDTSPLELRKTHKYVGTYSHLDEWESIGSYRRIQTHVTELDDDDYDPCQPVLHEHEVEVTTDADTDQIRQALLDGFTKWGCAHEYDCCGCRNFRATSAQPTGHGNRWLVKVSSSRNF